jgi:hypothetical protein
MNKLTLGRALWREAVHLQGAEREVFLQGKAVARWQSLYAVAEAYGHAWYGRYQTPSVDENWHTTYQTNQ